MEEIDKPSVFADLPEEDNDPEEPAGEPQNGDAKLKELSLALKEERRKRKEEADERAKLEEKLKTIPPPPPPDDERLREIARAELAAKEDKQYKDDLAAAIRARARSRQEAETIYEAALSLPKNGTPALDAELAIAYFDAKQKKSETFAPPSPMGGSPQPSGRHDIAGLSQDGVKAAHALGLSDDEIKKYSSDIMI